jgi:hypothetical protein
MIKRLGLATFVLLALIGASFAQTQICYKGTSGLNCVPVSVANPLPTAGVSGATATPVVGLGVANIATGQATVANTATLIVAARTGASGTGRKSVTIVNGSTTPVYVGASGVTTSTGILLPGTTGASLTLDTQAALYGIVASSTEAVSYAETY